MADEVKQAPEAKADEVVVNPQTIGEILGADEKQEVKEVPLAAFLEEKNARKEMEKELKSLKKQIESGATKTEVSDTIQSIAEEFNTDPKFLSRFAAAIKADADKEAEAKFTAKLKPFEEKEKSDRVQKVFDTHFVKSMDEMGEYKGIVNKDVIFALSLNPSNSSKTIPQLIEETYGQAISGRRSIETGTPRGGAPAGTFDPDRANKDVEYLKQVYKDPVLRKSYETWKETQR